MVSSTSPEQNPTATKVKVVYLQTQKRQLEDSIIHQNNIQIIVIKREQVLDVFVPWGKITFIMCKYHITYLYSRSYPWTAGCSQAINNLREILRIRAHEVIGANRPGQDLPSLVAESIQHPTSHIIKLPQPQQSTPNSLIPLFSQLSNKQSTANQRTKLPLNQSLYLLENVSYRKSTLAPQPTNYTTYNSSINEFVSLPFQFNPHPFFPLKSSLGPLLTKHR